MKSFLFASMLFSVFGCGFKFSGTKDPIIVDPIKTEPIVTGEYLTPMNTATIPDKIREYAPGIVINETSPYGWKVVDIEWIKEDVGQTKIWVMMMDQHEKPVCKYAVIGNPTKGQDFYKCGEIAEYTMGKLSSGGCGHHYAWIKDTKDQFGPQGRSDFVSCLGSWNVPKFNIRAGMLVKFKYFPAPNN